jgi:hypothetical protein
MSHADELQRIIDDGSRKVSEAYFHWIESTLSETDWTLFEDALERGEFDRAADLIKWDDLYIDEELQVALGKAAQINAEYLGDLTKSDFRYDLKDENALKWIQKHTLETVYDQIDNPSRKAVSEIVYRGMFSGYTPKEQAEFIKGVVGLDERQANSLKKLAENLTKKGLSPDEINATVEKAAKVAKNVRAGRIAVNETSEAATRGQYFSVKQACDRSIVNPNEWEGYRIVARDERLCDICAPLAGESRRLPDGVYASSGSVTTKLHILCRCVEGYRKIKKGDAMREPVARVLKGDGRSNFKIDTQGIKRKDGIIFIQTVPLIEGVYDQWGIRVFREYAEFSKYSHWLHGLAVVTNHEELTPQTRRIGQLFDVTNEDESNRVGAITRFYEMDLTGREVEKITGGEPLDGSLCWACYIEEAPGVWMNPRTGSEEHYDYREVGPYVFYEYSLVRDGVIGTEDGAGFNVQSKQMALALLQTTEDELMGKDDETPASPAGTKGAVSQNDGSGNMGPYLDRLERAEATAKEAMDAVEEDRKTRRFEAFKAALKPGYEEEAEKLFAEAEKDGAAFVMEHADKLASRGNDQGQHRQARGNPVGGGEKEFDLRAEQNKLWGRVR